MAANRVFIPQRALDAWLAEGKVDMRGDELGLLAEGRFYRIAEALRVTRLVSGGPDLHLLAGRVKTRAYLVELGAEIDGTTMTVVDGVYEVVPGFVGAPVSTFAEPGARASSPPPSSVASERPSLPSGLELADLAPLAPPVPATTPDGPPAAAAPGALDPASEERPPARFLLDRQ